MCEYFYPHQAVWIALANSGLDVNENINCNNLARRGLIRPSYSEPGESFTVSKESLDHQPEPSQECGSECGSVYWCSWSNRPIRPFLAVCLVVWRAKIGPACVAIGVFWLTFVTTTSDSHPVIRERHGTSRWAFHVGIRVVIRLLLLHTEAPGWVHVCCRATVKTSQCCAGP